MLTILGLFALPAAAAQADASWTGASTSNLWSTPSNWTRAAPTSNSNAGLLTFPDLSTNPACTATPTSTACYSTKNDLLGVSATGLVFNNNRVFTNPFPNNQPTVYQIQGTSSNGLTIGAKGITDQPGNNTSAVIKVPLALSAPQRWAIGLSFGSSHNSLTVLGSVTGPSSPVGVMFHTSNGAATGDLFVDSSMQVGDVTVDGVGGLHVGACPTCNHPGSVNGTDGNEVTMNSGSTLTANPGATVGPLTLNGAELLLGTNIGNTQPTTLGVNGSVTMDAATTTTAYINDNGSTPGLDFSQLAASSQLGASSDVKLAGQLIVGQGVGDGGCAVLNNGDVATLVTTSGTLSGTFAGVPDGKVVTMNGGSCQGTLPKVQIHYTTNRVTATVVTSTTTTSLTASPDAAATNQPVTLTATVSDGTATPSGTVAFSDNGTAVPGCSSQAVTASGSTWTATCTTSFGAATSPESLTGAFTGATGSGQATSSSALSLVIDKGSTATTLAASTRSPGKGGSVRYTATVTPSTGGARTPSGTVKFLDGGTAISGCTTKSLVSSAATCTVSYPSAGPHSIAASYGGDANFADSSSPATSVTVQSSTASTSPATQVGTTQATLNGSVSTGGASTTWKFEYGLSTAYNHATAQQTIAAGRATVSVSSVLNRLAPNVRYHYRLVVSSQTAVNASAQGRDLTFTTKNTGKLVGPAGRLTVIGRTILVSEKCQSNVLCSGRFSLTTKARVGKKKLMTVVCASAGFRIKAHRKRKARVRLSSTCLSLLKPHRRLTVTYTAQSGTGQLGQRKRVTLVLK